MKKASRAAAPTDVRFTERDSSLINMSPDKAETSYDEKLYGNTEQGNLERGD